MRRWLAMLTGLRRLNSLRERLSTGVVQPNGFLTTKLLEYLPDLGLQSTIGMPGSSSAEQGLPASTLPTLVYKARSIEEALQARPEIIPSLEFIARTVATLCAIDTVGNIPEAFAVLVLDNFEITRCFRTIRVSATNEEADAIIVGNELGKTFTVLLSDTNYATTRLKIGYAYHTRYPELILHTPSQSIYDRRPKNRERWLQKATQAYDIDLYTHSRWKKGTVSTRLIEEGRAVLNGRQIQVNLSAQSGIDIIETKVYNELGKCIVRCLRMVEQPTIVT